MTTSDARRSKEQVRECWSYDEADYSYPTLGDLIDSHRDDLKAGSIVFVGEPVHPSPTSFVDADDICEMLADRAYDLCGDHAEDFPDVTSEAKAELDALLNAWCEKHCDVTFYEVANSHPYTITAEDLA
jgi:hypothetical protein